MVTSVLLMASHRSEPLLSGSGRSSGGWAPASPQPHAVAIARAATCTRWKKCLANRHCRGVGQFRHDAAAPSQLAASSSGGAGGKRRRAHRAAQVCGKRCALRMARGHLWHGPRRETRPQTSAELRAWPGHGARQGPPLRCGPQEIREAWRRSSPSDGLSPCPRRRRGAADAAPTNAWRGLKIRRRGPLQWPSTSFRPSG